MNGIIGGKLMFEKAKDKALFNLNKTAKEMDKMV